MKRKSKPNSESRRESRYAALLRRLASPQFFVPAVLVVGAYTALAEGRYTIWDARRTEAELAEYRERIEDTRRRIDSLTARVQQLQDDDAALEQVAREEYCLIRDGEILYRVP